MSDSAFFLPIGSMLVHQYKILMHIGAGGFGKTYLVEDQLGAKKVVKEFFMSSICTREASTQSVSISIEENKEVFQQHLARFKEEARRIYSLSHPNIVRVSALFDDNDTAYYVMDYVEGESLFQKCHKEKLTEVQIVRYLDQLLSALDYIHSRGITHLDIKPNNIMIDRDDNVVLIDFGASKLFNAQSTNKTMMTSMRPPYTPGYAPIEQENGNVKDMGPHCDIYALGATLYYLYTGVKPASPFEISQNGLPPISSASPIVEAAIRKAMAFWVKDRIKSVAEFRKELEQLENTPTTRIGNENTIIVGEVDIQNVQQSTFSKEITKTDASALHPITTSELKSFTQTINGVSFKMIAVEGGSFKMGAQSNDSNKPNFDLDAYHNESPVHDVTLDSFYIAEVVVTEELWDAVMTKNKNSKRGLLKRLFCNKQTPRVGYPKTNISWNDCQEFITKLNEKIGKNFCLPTEAQWEFAARGGNRSHGYKYSGSNVVSDVAWQTLLTSDVGARPIGSKLPNELGIYEMSGNLWECCSDWYGDYNSSSQINPTGATVGAYRVLRGGVWVSDAQSCRITSRHSCSQDYRFCYGLRLVLCP